MSTVSILVSELIGVALDWAVAMCEGVVTEFQFDGITYSFKLDGSLKVLASGWAPSMNWNPSSNWSCGGPIIEREMKSGFDVWSDRKGNCFATYERGLPDSYVSGPTPLIAAMRCRVASKLGITVNVPSELLN